MRLSLYPKLLALLLLVTLIALSSSLILRNFVIRDFKAFGEGRMLDRIYQLQAVLEGRYEESGRWEKAAVRDDLARAWHSGIELKLYDADDHLVLDTDQAIAELPAVMKQRIIASGDRRPPSDAAAIFQSYPLFLHENEIGRLDVRLPRPVHESFFIKSSNRFLAYIVIALGLTAILLSFIVVRRITRPIQELTDAAEKMASGEAGRLVSVTSNDEIGRLASTFNRMSEALAAQDKMRKQLVSNAAHELRTPLMIIKGELEGMMDGLLPTSPDALQSLHDEATRLTSILDGVDELTRAQAASLNINRQRVELEPFITQVLSRFARQAEEQNVKISVTADHGCTAMLDPEQFTRVIINLASNALRAMPGGGNLQLQASTNEHKITTIRVIDTGTGIAPDQLSHIFERFYKGKDGGLGLGLAIVKELVEANGGRISVTSDLGNGASFLIELLE